MKKSLSVSIPVCLCFLAGMANAASWTKYVAADKSYSFHYPAGWKVKPGESIIQISSPAASDEEMLVIAIPGDASKTPGSLRKTPLGSSGKPSRISRHRTGSQPLARTQALSRSRSTARMRARATKARRRC